MHIHNQVLPQKQRKVTFNDTDIEKSKSPKKATLKENISPEEAALVDPPKKAKTTLVTLIDADVEAKKMEQQCNQQ